MRRYEFRLESVLRLRRAQRLAEREVLRIANESLRRALAGQEESRIRFEARTFQSGEMTLDDLRAERTHHELLAASLAAAASLTDIRAGEVALARVNWTVAERRVVALERLEARRKEEWLLGERRDEALLVDDLNTASYTRELADAESSAVPR